MKKVFLSADMEGTAGITHWNETDAGKHLYDHFARQMTQEVAAACEGAVQAGAEDILVKDGHDSARNIDPSQLPECVRILRGWAKHPYSMMAGLDESFEGVLFTGYHSAASWSTSPLSHTMNTRNNYVTINGEVCSELMLNCMTAAMLGVPVLFVSGDQGICDWIKTKIPGVVTVPVSEGRGNASISIHPNLAVKRIRAGAEQAISAQTGGLYPMPDNFHVEICFKDHFNATSAQHYPGCRLVNSKTVEFHSKEYMDVLKFIYWVL